MKASGPVRTLSTNGTGQERDRAPRWNVVSPRWGSASKLVGSLRIPGLRCAPTWAIESRPVGAEDQRGANGTGQAGRDTNGTGRVDWDGIKKGSPHPRPLSREGRGEKS